MESDQQIQTPIPITRARQGSLTLRYLGPGLLAIAAGLLGQFLLYNERTRLAGFGIIVLAALLAALFLPALASSLPRSQSSATADLLAKRALALRLAGIASSVLLSVASLFAWFADPDAVFGLQGVLWIFSMALLVVSCVRWPMSRDQAIASEAAWPRAEKLVFAALVALALCTYLINLDAIPWRFHYDEALAYIETMRYFKGPPISVFTTTWSGTGLPSLWFVFPASLMHIVGTGLAGVRSGVALAGALTIIPVYGLARLMAGRVAAVIAAFAWAASPVAIQYSRISIINMTTGLAWAVCFLFLIKGLRSRSPAHFMWAGLAGGLSMYTYYGTRLLPYLIVAFALFLLIFHFRSFKAIVPHFALLGVSFFVGFGPLLAYFIRHPDVWTARGLSELAIPATIPTSVDAIAADWNALAPLIERNFLGLSVLISNDSCYWGTFFSPLWAVLFLLGAGVLLVRWRNPDSALLLLWIGGVLFVGGTLVGKRFIPDYAHWTPAFPAFFVILAIPPALWLRSLAKAPRSASFAALGIVAAAALVQAGADGYWYLNVYPGQVPRSFEDAEGRLLASLTPHDRVLFIGNSWQPFYSAIGEMMAPNVPASDLLNPARELPLEPDPDHDITFVFDNDETKYLPIVQSYYPGGKIAPISSPVGYAYTYSLTAEQVVARYGVLLTLTGSDGKSRTSTVSQVGELPPNISYPVTATWNGLFMATSPAEHVTLNDWKGASLSVEGRPVSPETTPPLAPGWVPFSVQARLDGPRTLGLYSLVGSGAPTEVPPGHLWPQAPGEGLAVTVSRDGSTLSTRVDPYAGSSLWGTNSFTLGGLIPAPLTRDPNFLAIAPDEATQATWQGELYTESGIYTFNLRTDAAVEVTLDGKTLFSLRNLNPTYPPKGGDTGVDNHITLAQGWHPIRMSISPTGNANGLELSWIRPDGTSEIIPPSRFRYFAPAQPASK